MNVHLGVFYIYIEKKVYRVGSVGRQGGPEFGKESESGSGRSWVEIRGEYDQNTFYKILKEWTSARILMWMDTVQN